MEMLILGGKHVRAVISRSPFMRPSTRSPHVGGGARGTLQRTLYGLSSVAAAYGRAPSRSRRTVHHAWRTTQRSSRSRTGARRSRLGCSRSGRDTPKDERKRIAYFDLLKKNACPCPPSAAPFRGRGGRTTIIMTSQNQFAADAPRSFCGSTPVLAPSDRAQRKVDTVTRATLLPLPTAKHGNMRRRRLEGGRDRILSAAAWAPRDPRRVADGGGWTDFGAVGNLSLVVVQGRFAQNPPHLSQTWHAQMARKMALERKVNDEGV